VTNGSPRATIASGIRTWWPIIAAAGVITIAGVVAIPLGGWDTVVPQSTIIPEHPVGETFVSHRVSVSIDDLYLTDTHPDGFTEVEPGETFLVVVATMASETDQPEIPITSSSYYPFTIPGVIELGVNLESGAYSTLLERDGTFGPIAIPGLADTILFVFAVRSSQFEEGDVVRIGLTDETPEEADIIEGTRWVDVHTAAEVPITVRDER
jgi:hypothetical protein